MGVATDRGLVKVDDRWLGRWVERERVGGMYVKRKREEDNKYW